MTGRADSYGQRLLNASAATGVDVNRLRRGLVFQRILARLSGSEQWVLKGGYCLEVRLALTARATKDLDLVTAWSWGDGGGEGLQDLLDATLDVEVDDDGFQFLVAPPKRVRQDGHREVWRVSVEARVGGRHFQAVALDIVSQMEELAGAIEPLTVPPPISGAGLAPAVIQAVDVAQHAAEKFHALARTYAGDRPSSRVKDLVDLVLLIEAGVLDTVAVGKRLRVVYRERDSSEPAPALPDPPTAWAGDYRALVERNSLDVGADTAETAHALAAAFYQSALAPEQEGDST